MFGILYYIFLGLFKVFYEIYVSIVNTINRIGGLRGDGKSLGYMDYHGAYRDRVTNKVMYPDNKTGTFVDYKGNMLYDPKIAKIKKYREENKRKAIEEGKSVYVWLKETDKWNYQDRGYFKNIKGKIVCDIKTKDIYAIKSFGTTDLKEDWYINIKTGEAVRITDEQKEFYNTHKDFAPSYTYCKLVKDYSEEIKLKKELLRRIVDFHMEKQKGKYLEDNSKIEYFDPIINKLFFLY